jgi:hypothetical protein
MEVGVVQEQHLQYLVAKYFMLAVEEVVVIPLLFPL